MAWADNSAVRNMGKYEDWKNAPKETQPVNGNGIGRFFTNLPFVKILSSYLQSLRVPKKLQKLHHKINSKSIDNFSDILSILKELRRLTKISSDAQKEIIIQLRKTLIAKSHQTLFADQKVMVSPKKIAVGSHKNILDSLRLEKKQDAILPTTLYWCTDAEQNSYAEQFPRQIGFWQQEYKPTDSRNTTDHVEEVTVDQPSPLFTI